MLTLSEYQKIAQGTDQNSEAGLEGLHFFLLGLFGEAGTLLSALKKKRRDGVSFSGYEASVQEEFGDVLWYLANIASRASLDLNVLAQRASLDLGGWDNVRTTSATHFGDVQRAVTDSLQFEAALIGLAGKVGLLLNDVHRQQISGNRDFLSGHLIEIFRALLEAAVAANVSLADAAAANVAKIQSRWPPARSFFRLFDEESPALEQLPRRIEMHIFEVPRGGRAVVIQQCNGINIGSQLTDNRAVGDDYRFHDVFHLANAALLGWSPVMRALFKVKRKSSPSTDEAQDGARAILIEEGLSTLVFHRASRLNHFEGVAALDYSLLKMIPEFVAGFEVEACPLWQWEQAILAGYSVFRQLRQAKRGIVIADLHDRSITFRPLPQ